MALTVSVREKEYPSNLIMHNPLHTPACVQALVNSSKPICSLAVCSRGAAL